jgi:hypothetical protein
MQCFITRAPCDWKAAEHPKDDTKRAKKMLKIAVLGAENEKCPQQLQWLHKLEKQLEKTLNSASGIESGGGREDEGKRTKRAGGHRYLKSLPSLC